MSSGDTSLRQKMINLLYLIFISIVAISVSDTVLITYKDTASSLNDSKISNENKNKLLYSSLKIRSEDDHGKYGDLYQNALDVNKNTSQVVNFLEEIKNDLFKEVDINSIDDEIPYSKLENNKVTNKYFFTGWSIFGSKKPSKKGKKLIEEFNNLRNYLNQFIKSNGGKFLNYSTLINKSLNTDRISVRGKKLSWLEAKFNDVPFVSVLATLSQKQAEIRAIESDLVSTMLEGHLSKEVSYKNYSTLLSTSKSAFFTGENIEGSVVLGRQDETTKPVAVNLKVDGKTLKANEDFELSGGKVILKFKVGSIGEHNITGNLLFTEGDSTISVPVNNSYVVIPKPNTAVISNEKMNVLYRAVNNPLSISVPGVSDYNIKVSGSGLRKISEGKYNSNVTNVKGKTLEIRVLATLPDGKTINTSETFRIKDIPAPQGTIRGRTEDKMPISSFINSTVGASLVDFPFDLKLNVESFTVKIPGIPTIKVKGSRMNDRVKRSISSIKPGEQVIIGNIQATVQGVSNYRLKKVSPIVVTITGR